MSMVVKRVAKWWNEKPIRLIQTNLRELDAQRDPREIVRQVKAFGANAILFSVGGIVSFYPTALEFQTPTPYLHGDFVGEALDEAHAQGLRFIARLDLSKCPKRVYEHHPEWFFLGADGRPMIYNGLYATCINGGYYRDYAFTIMREILDRYDVDGLFFNMFGYPGADYSGKDHGLCQCANCRARFQEMFGHALPKTLDLEDPAGLEFVRFREATVDELTRAVSDFIHAARENVAFMTYTTQHVDIIRDEAESSLAQPPAAWPYDAGDNVRRARGTCPHKPVSNAATYFLDYPYRFSSVSPHLTALRLAQNIAQGTGLDLYVLGTLDQEDRTALRPAQEIFQFFAQHEAAYHGLTSLARACLVFPSRSYAYGKSKVEAYRGLYRLLAERHILFDCADDSVLAGEDAERAMDRYDLLIVPDAACLSDRQAACLDGFVQRGGRLLATGATGLYDGDGRPRSVCGLQSLGLERVAMVRPDMRSAYFVVDDRARLSGLDETDLVFLDGPYLYPILKPGCTSSLRLVAPSVYGPPEKCFCDRVDTDLPGVLWYRYGKGTTAYVPWNVDRLYERHGSPGHAQLLASVLTGLAGDALQVRTNAHPLVELSLFARAGGGFVLSLVNFSGCQSTASYAPIPIHGIEIQVRLPQPVTTARSLRQARPLPLWRDGEYTALRLDTLDLFDTILLQ